MYQLHVDRNRGWDIPVLRCSWEQGGVQEQRLARLHPAWRKCDRGGQGGADTSTSRHLETCSEDDLLRGDRVEEDGDWGCLEGFQEDSHPPSAHAGTPSSADQNSLNRCWKEHLRNPISWIHSHPQRSRLEQLLSDQSQCNSLGPGERDAPKTRSAHSKRDSELCWHRLAAELKGEPAVADLWQLSALCNKSNGRCDIKAEKREELESKSSHKSDIWLPAASKKWGEIYWKYIFQTLEAIFPYKGVFVTKVVKANIIAFIKTKILRPVLSVTNPPFQKCQPLLHSALVKVFSNSAITGVGRPRPGVRGRKGSRPGNWQGPLDGVGKAHRVHLWGYSDRNFNCTENISMIYLRKLKWQMIIMR